MVDLRDLRFRKTSSPNYKWFTSQAFLTKTSKIFYPKSERLHYQGILNYKSSREDIGMRALASHSCMPVGWVLARAPRLFLPVFLTPSLLHWKKWTHSHSMDVPFAKSYSIPFRCFLFIFLTLFVYSIRFCSHSRALKGGYPFQLHARAPSVYTVTRQTVSWLVKNDITHVWIPFLSTHVWYHFSRFATTRYTTAVYIIKKLR